MKITKKQQLLLIITGIFFIIFLLFITQNNNKPIKFEIKNDYSLKEILDVLNKNYSQISTIKMKFSCTWIDEKNENNPFEYSIPKANLYHSFIDNKLKIETSGLELIRDENAKIWGNYKTKETQQKYYQLVNWLITTYESIILFPIKVDLTYINSQSPLQWEKLPEKGNYKLSFSYNTNSIKVNFVVDMNYGIIKNMTLVEKITLIETNKQKTYYPYLIKAELNNIGSFNHINFPQEIKIKFLSKNDKFSFYSKINSLIFNKSINEKNLALNNNNNQVTWYNYPYWLNDDTLILIKGHGNEVKNAYGDIVVLNKNFFIVTKNIINNKEEVLKNLFFSKDDVRTSRFAFSADYNKKNNELAYALYPIESYTNHILNKISGLFLWNRNKNTTVKVSDTGFLPSWSKQGLFLIWNEEEPNQKDKTLNNIWLYEKMTEEKRLIIKNGFHYQWGKDDGSIIYEKGTWSYGKEYLNSKATRDKGIYIYNLLNESSVFITDGYYPQISDNQETLLYSDLNGKSSIYLMDLKNFDITKQINFEKNEKPIQAFWFNQDKNILFIKSGGPDIIKYGLYTYSLSQDVYDHLSNQIGMKTNFNYTIIPSSDNEYLLYQINKLPNWSFSMWGIFNIKSKKIKLNDSTFL